MSWWYHVLCFTCAYKQPGSPVLKLWYTSCTCGSDINHIQCIMKCLCGVVDSGCILAVCAVVIIHITLLVKVSAAPIIRGNCSPCGLCHTDTNKSDFPSNASGHYYTVLSMLSLSESRRSRVPSHIFPPCHCFGIQFLKPVILCQKLRFVCCLKELIVEIAQETNCRTP